MGANRRFASFKIDGHETVGERLRVDGRISRTGIQIYHDESGERREWRDPSEVFADDSLASMRGMTVTIGHPAGPVTPANWRGLSVGHVGDDVRQDDDGKHVAASLWVHDAAAIRRIQDRELIELSVGYETAVDMTPGVAPTGEHYDARQTNIRGNHVAMLRAGQARGGATVALRLDAAGDEIIESEHAGGEPEGDSRMKFRITVDGVTYEVEAADDGLGKAVDEAVQARDDAKAAATKAEAERDAAIDERDKLNERVDAYETDEADRQRADAIEAAHRIAPEMTIADGSSVADIHRAALTESGVKLDGKDDAYVQARFDVAIDALEEKTETTTDAAGEARATLHGRTDATEITAEQLAASSIDGSAMLLMDRR